MTRCLGVLLFLFALFTSFAQAQFTRETYTSRQGPVHVADFNHDGYYDILDLDRVRLNDHSGGFSTYYSATSYTPNVNRSTAISDFNGDGYPDIAICRLINNADATVVLLNTKQNSFTTSQILTGCGSFAAADLNKDGKQDLVMGIRKWDGTQYISQMKTYFGDGAGKFASPVVQTLTLPSPDLDYTCRINKIAVADFKAVSRYDLVIDADCEGDVANFGHLYYGQNNLNGTYQITADGYSGIVPFISEMRVANLNTDTRPDLYYLNFTTGPHDGFTTADAFMSNGDGTFTTRPLGGADSGCGDIGAMVAGQFTSDTLADFVVGYLHEGCSDPTAHLVLQKATSAGVWTDETSGTVVSYDSIPRDAASADFNHDNRDDFVTVEHTLESDSDRLVVYRNIQTYLTTSCKPSGAGVHVCQPTQPSYSSNVIGFRAAATGISGAVRLMQLYIDGKKAGDYRDDIINTAFSLTPGSHSATFVALEFNGLTSRKTVNFTVGSSTTTCSAAAGTLKICSPTAGSTVSSPVKFVASVNAGRSISAMKIYIDGVSRYQNTGSSTLNTSLSVATGTHQLTIKTWDGSGKVYSSSESFTVK